MYKIFESYSIRRTWRGLSRKCNTGQLENYGGSANMGLMGSIKPINFEKRVLKTINCYRNQKKFRVQSFSLIIFKLGNMILGITLKSWLSWVVLKDFCDFQSSTLADICKQLQKYLQRILQTLSETLSGTFAETFAETIVEAFAETFARIISNV